MQARRRVTAVPAGRPYHGSMHRASRNVHEVSRLRPSQRRLWSVAENHPRTIAVTLTVVVAIAMIIGAT